MHVVVKICGLTTPGAVESAVTHGADYIGFIFFPPSPRNITFARAAELSSDIPAHIKKVAVTVDMEDRLFHTMLDLFKPDYLQLHGQETAEQVKTIRQKFGIPVIKAIPIRQSDDIAEAKLYEPVADMLLFDAKAPKNSTLPGGNGISFDWKLLANRQFTIPWMLSGGLNAENVLEAIHVSGAQGIDLSSSLEISPGVKDPQLIRELLQKVKG